MNNETSTTSRVRKLFRMTSGASLAVVTFAFCLSAPVSAATIYVADISSAPGGSSVNAHLGWNAYNNSGLDLSNSTNDPVFLVNFGSGRLLVGDDTNTNAAYVLITNQSIDPSNFENDLTISHTGFLQDRTTDNGIGIRTLVEVGGTWYGTDLLETYSSDSIVVSASVWRSWEADVTDGFNPTGFGGTLQALPSGIITNTGLFYLDAESGEDDAVDFRSYEITATVIPEPSSIVLMGLAVVVGLIRFRKMRA